MDEDMDQSSQSSSELRPITWTFVVKGGEDAVISLKEHLGPPLVHKGGTTVYHFVGTLEDAESLTHILEGPEVGARVTKHALEDTEEMDRIREKRLGRKLL